MLELERGSPFGKILKAHFESKESGYVLVERKIKDFKEYVVWRFFNSGSNINYYNGHYLWNLKEADELFVNLIA